jgi:hypothetical protein
MIELYAMEDHLRTERESLARRHARDAVWIESQRRSFAKARPAMDAGRFMRRRLARTLLALADRLDPRTAVRVPHAPARPALNGTLRRA